MSSMNSYDYSYARESLFRRFLQYWLLGNMAAAIAYGIALTLSLNCLFLLARSTTTSKRVRRVMMALVVCMCCVSTTSLVCAGGGVVVWSLEPTIYNVFTFDTPMIWGQPFSRLELIFIVFATWFSDGFMIWRCIMLYHGVFPGLWMFISTLVILLTSASLAAGVCAIVTPLVGTKWQEYSIFTLFELISLIVNGSVSSLIILRILYHQRFLRRIFGAEYGSTYTKLMSMLIESASLTFLLSLLHIVIAAAQGKPTVVQSPMNMVLIKLISPINTISPLLIIFRVAQGRTWQTDPTVTIASLQNGHELGALEFAHHDSTSTIGDTLSFDNEDFTGRDEENGVSSHFQTASTKSIQG